MDCSPPGSSVHGILQARKLEWVAIPISGDLPNPGIEPRSPTLQEDSLPAEPPGKPKNTGVGSLSFPQQLFPTQELNWGLVHCRQILYQLSYQGSPKSLSYVQLFATPWTIQSMEFPVPGIKLRFPTLQEDSLPAEPPGKAKNTGVCGLSLLQWIFLTQESTQGLLHRRRILYPLSYQRSAQ